MNYLPPLIDLNWKYRAKNSEIEVTHNKIYENEQLSAHFDQKDANITVQPIDYEMELVQFHFKLNRNKISNWMERLNVKFTLEKQLVVHRVIEREYYRNSIANSFNLNYNEFFYADLTHDKPPKITWKRTWWIRYLMP